MFAFVLDAPYNLNFSPEGCDGVDGVDGVSGVAEAGKMGSASVK
jgi:hypothetical protein